MVAALRAELAAVEPARACCRRAERTALGDAATGRARSAGVARLAVRLDERTRATEERFTFAWASSPDHCRMAWLRGRFLVGGSLSLSAGQTHLELVVLPEEGEQLSERLRTMSLPASSRVRRGRGVVTLKGREAVITLLRRMGATAAVLDLESRGVMETLHGQLNRAINAESANLSRTVAASSRQIGDIELLQASGGWDGLSALDQRIARRRCDSPEDSLREMAEGLGVSRSQVQRSLRRLEFLAALSRTEPGVG